MRFGAFIKNATNCSRFVTDTVISSTTNPIIKKKLQRSKRFMPSIIGNVVISDTGNCAYLVSDQGAISEFKSTVKKTGVYFSIDFKVMIQV